jgi:hypothetical protein
MLAGSSSTDAFLAGKTCCVARVSSGARFLDLLLKIEDSYDGLENGEEVVPKSYGPMFVDILFVRLGRSYDGMRKGEEIVESCKLAFVDFLSAAVYALYAGIGLTTSFVEEATSSGPECVDWSSSGCRDGFGDSMCCENGKLPWLGKPWLAFGWLTSSGPMSPDPLRSLIEDNA